MGDQVPPYLIGIDLVSDSMKLALIEEFYISMD
jgi:hypothetical protein